MRPLLSLLVLAIIASAQARTERLTPAFLAQERQAMLAARTAPQVTCGLAVDARTDIVAFPAGRSDRLYTSASGIGRAYARRGGRAGMVWCGKAISTPAEGRWASKLEGNAARAL